MPKTANKRPENAPKDKSPESWIWDAAWSIRVREWAEKLDVTIVWLAVRPMRNKWASCSTKGHLHFNTELLDLKQGFSDYVIVHELLHFCVPNHGKLWKSLMRAHLGDYEEMERKLKKLALQPS